MRSITIDIWDKLRERISVPQREILGRTLQFTITDRGTPVNLTGGTVTMYAVKPDASVVFNALTLVTPASGIAKITLTEQMVVAAGTLSCTLLIVDSGANETRTQPFEIEVITSPDFTSSVESTSEYNAFSTALSTYSGIDARVTGLEDGTSPAGDSDKLEAHSMADLLADFKLAMWPVGSIYTTIGATSPATLFGGTWVAFGAGKVMVGLDAGQTEFDTIEETGGEKTHALTEAENGQHSHVLSSDFGRNAGTTGVLTLGATYESNTTIGSMSSSGSGTAHNNLQPYIVVRMWKRTA